ncbi:WD40 repeat-like protein [Metschnikowia bicuspidata var. bicuspidata NRRL YB-4993]|uniref:ASTRA-associated protein 1 n=1 Tax=Metschnikowia bicuspidata var. bicuspidata NRRL YB-4993 TaxID=869754 RepID=A0A1A0H4X6_9ASCO|nr:WD40 repeat-like protein [Metschnikowia bicuspidata var. bicuspidata NRRL YB-4993]OBA18962.1 WD40 repeat-like protein [Metschnikowia bicuspidata var. bicuspidata NRRL YB-4993]
MYALSKHLASVRTQNYPMLPKFSLRAHKAPLTCLTCHQDKLVSSDRDGFIIIWNLTSRRPMALWRAHDGHILTLKLSPMGLISHGRDSMIRIWDLSLEYLKTCSENMSDIAALGAKLNPLLPQPIHAEIPVNALNFCNVDFCDGMMITPATVDSDNFDIYEVSDPFGLFNFKRVLQNISPLSLLRSEHLIEEIGASQHQDKRGGNGVIMRTLFVERSLFFVGYESGAIYGFSIEQNNHDKASVKERSIIFKDCNLSIVFSLHEHNPLPILSLVLNSATSELYTGSASKKLICYNVRNLLDIKFKQDENTSNFTPHNLRHYGIQCIQITNKMILTGFWDGVIKGFTNDFEEATRLERKEESIRPEHDGEISKPAKKSICMEIWAPCFQNSSVSCFNGRKNTLRRAATGKDTLLFVGYGDGLITAFKGIN